MEHLVTFYSLVARSVFLDAYDTRNNQIFGFGKHWIFTFGVFGGLLSDKQKTKGWSVPLFLLALT